MFVSGVSPITRDCNAAMALQSLTGIMSYALSALSALTSYPLAKEASEPASDVLVLLPPATRSSCQLAV